MWRGGSLRWGPCEHPSDETVFALHTSEDPTVCSRGREVTEKHRFLLLPPDSRGRAQPRGRSLPEMGSVL